MSTAHKREFDYKPRASTAHPPPTAERAALQERVRALEQELHALREELARQEQSPPTPVALPDATSALPAEGIVQLYQNLVANSPMGMHFYTLDAADRLIFTGANPTADRLLGVSHAQFIGKTIEEAFPPLAHTEIPARYREAARDGTLWETQQIEYADTQIAGAYEVHAFQTTPGKMVAVFLDITNRKRIEAALQAKTAELESYFTSALDLLCIADTQGHFRRLNREWELTLGYTLEELEGQQFMDLVHPDDRAATLEAVSHLTAQTEVLNFVNRYRCKNGAYRWIEWRSVPVGEIIYATARDITTRIETEQALRESQQQLIEANTMLQLVLDAIPVRIFWKDREARYLGCNRRFAQDAGYDTPAAIIGKDDFSMAWRAQAEQYRADDFQVMRSGEAKLNYEEPQTPLEGEPLWLRTSKVPMQNTQGEVIGVLGVYEDITAAKAAQEALNRLNEELELRVRQRTAQLEAANAELEAFTYSVSHDLRAPLRALDGFSQALLEDYAGQFDAEGQLYLQRLRAASQRMGQLIDDLLHLSRVTRAEMTLAPVKLSEMVREIATALQESQPERQVTFTIAPDVVVIADPGLLRIAMENLLNNAWKYTSKHAQAHIEFGMQQQERETVYFVRDDGAGFDMAFADKLFGAFQRLHQMTEFEGAGIGLATVWRIIQRHGGKVWAEGAIERGATFFFSLPQSLPAAALRPHP